MVVVVEVAVEFKIHQDQQGQVVEEKVHQELHLVQPTLVEVVVVEHLEVKELLEVLV